ncbi:glycosyltransferase [Marinovum sp.]|uniref:glycosyltransferase n=1 Tax=Marinovum sp. TaxID=2024839 RepID=UPI003A93A73F
MIRPAPQASPLPPEEPPEVCILMAVYNGAAHLDEQLDSFAAQSHPAWSLIASDDGSRDDSMARIAEFAARHPGRSIRCRPGPRRGFVRNFLSLLEDVPEGVPYAAFSDQDDVWFPDKLARATAALSAVPADRPAVYCAATFVCQTDLRPLGPSSRLPRPPDFRNALVQSIGGGHTMVLNRAAIALAAGAARRAPDPVVHDWWLYQLITGCGGVILRDPDPVLHYRQHGANLIGANITGRARLSRILALVSGRFRRWNHINLAALAPIERDFTPEARHTLAHFRAARQGRVWHRLRHLRASGVYRQSRIGSTALYLACLLGRL